mgnify:CR=1 FL=1
MSINNSILKLLNMKDKNLTKMKKKSILALGIAALAIVSGYGGTCCE